MAYTAFNPANPSTGQTRQAAIDSIRSNLMAVRDALVLGNLPGFNYAWSGGSAAQPAVVTRTKGSEIIRGSISWVSGGAADGSPGSIVYEYSANAGSSYDAIGTCTFSWDANGYLASTTWS